MNSGFVPKGNYSLKNLIERVVERRHGGNAIAEVTIHGGEHHLETERAGERIPYHEDGERWESARESIRQALEAGILTASFEDSNAREKYIPKSDWEILRGDSFAESYATLSYCTLQHGDFGSSRGALVCISTLEADAFINTLDRETANSRIETPTQSDENIRAALLAVPKKGATLKDYQKAYELIGGTLPKKGKGKTYDEKEVLRCHNEELASLKGKCADKVLSAAEKKIAVQRVQEKFSMASYESTHKYLTRHKAANLPYKS